MCEVMQKYEKIAVNEERISAIQRMLKKKYSKEQILELDYTEEEFFQAELELLQLA